MGGAELILLLLVGGGLYLLNQNNSIGGGSAPRGSAGSGNIAININNGGGSPTAKNPPKSSGGGFGGGAGGGGFGGFGGGSNAFDESKMAGSQVTGNQYPDSALSTLPVQDQGEAAAVNTSDYVAPATGGVQAAGEGAVSGFQEALNPAIQTQSENAAGYYGPGLESGQYFGDTSSGDYTDG